jgi:hypothetical protein
MRCQAKSLQDIVVSLLDVENLPLSQGQTMLVGWIEMLQLRLQGFGGTAGWSTALIGGGV